MPTFVAIDLCTKHEALLVTGEALNDGGITLLGTKRVSLPEQEEASNAEETQKSHPQASLLEELTGEQVDGSLAVASSPHILFGYTSFPFNDPKKIAQVAPLQLQDSVPFQIDDFVLDTMELGQSNGQFGFLSSLMPDNEVAGTLEYLSRIGADPKVLSTKSSAVAALKELCQEELGGTAALIVPEQNSCALAIFVEEELKFLRDIPLSLQNGHAGNLCENIRCSLARVEKDYRTQIQKLFMIGQDEQASALSEQLGRAVSGLNLEAFVHFKAGFHTDPNEIPWAIGLLASQSAAKKSSAPTLVDFRRGAFAYRPTWGNFLTALREESFYIGLAAFFLLFWIGTILYTGSQQLNSVDNAVERELNSVLPGESIPYLRERDYLQDRVSELEEKLRELGTLSSLSPLDSLQILSTVIPAEIDIAVDNLGVGRTGLSFRGSVLNFPSVGKLSSALEKQKDRFCEVKVNSSGKEFGTSRVKFTAEVTFCE